MKVTRLDHLVLTVDDVDATVRFYTEILGMTEVTFGDARKALKFGESKINLHQRGREFEPKAANPTPGSADVCLIVEGPLDAVADELRDRGAHIVEGPVQRTGALGPIDSVYVRDPDDNLIELSTLRPR